MFTQAHDVFPTKRRLSDMSSEVKTSQTEHIQRSRRGMGGGEFALWEGVWGRARVGQDM